jgi:GTP-binding protein LepA
MEYRIKNQISKIINFNAEGFNFEFHILNLIDTPGHVDFSYEVERTLACVEGVILLVDATCGVQAQTIAHTHKALEQNLVIIPVVNKIDLPTADIKKTKKQIAEFLRIDEDEIFEVSAKTGKNVEKLLQAVIEKVPPPVVGIDFNLPETVAIHESPLQSLIFDSYYDQYRGVIAFIRVFNGEITAGMKVSLHANKKEFVVLEVGVFTPDLKPTNNLSKGEIGYLVTNLKDIHKVSIGDTIVDKIDTPPLPGYKKAKPMVFTSVFTTEPNDFTNLKRALEKLSLNDAALTFEAIYSSALGSGFRVGFLGLLHADVVRERLEREFDLSLILTPPTVEYLSLLTKDAKRNYLEPIVKVNLITPQEYTGVVMRLCEEARGKFLTMDNKTQVCLSYEIPLSELITNFYDRLKTITSGYASLDWHFLKHQSVDVDKLLIFINNENVDEFSEFVVAERAFIRAQEITKKLKELVPRQQFEIKIQARYKGKIISSERISPFRKDVLKKLYGGDRSRKNKLLEKQKKGKKMMKNIGRVEIPKEAFSKLFRG